MPGGGIAEFAGPSFEQEKRTLPSLMCHRAGLLPGLQCQGPGAAGPRRPSWFMLRPGCSRRGAWPCPTRKGAWQDFAAVTPLAASSMFSHTHAAVQTRTRVQMQARTSANMLVRIHMDLRLGRRTHANTDANGAVLVRACSPCRGRRVRVRTAPGLYTLLHSQTWAAEQSHSTGLFLGALLRIVSMLQMLES